MMLLSGEISTELTLRPCGDEWKRCLAEIWLEGTIFYLQGDSKCA